MAKIAIVTDSNAGIHQSEKPDDLFIVPMPFMIDENEYFEDVNLSVDDFYKALIEDKKISTSQPSPGDVTALWDEVLKSYDYIVHIPMSSGLSMSYQTACMLAEDYKNKVFVVDAKRISVTMKQVCNDALVLAQKGKTPEEIKSIIEENALMSSIYIMVDTLKYLRRGGRITPVVAAFGALLKIKPVLTIQGDKLDSYAKVMNVVQAKQRMISAIKRDIENRFTHEFANNELVIGVGHTNNRQKAIEFAEEIRKYIPDIEINYVDELSLSVACHIGAGALAVAITKKLA